MTNKPTDAEIDRFIDVMLEYKGGIYDYQEVEYYSSIVGDLALKIDIIFSREEIGDILTKLKEGEPEPQPTDQRLKERIQELGERMHQAKEIYYGMEGHRSQTAPEEYLLRLLKEMYTELESVKGDPRGLPGGVAEGIETKDLLREMTEQVVWTDKASMPIPLYEKIKDALKGGALTNNLERNDHENH